MTVASGLWTLSRARGRAGWNNLLSVRRHSTLKIVVIVVFALGLWAGLYFFFMDGFHFFDRELIADFRPFVVDMLFAVFFLSLLVMLLFSNGIIAYGSLFRSHETAFLLSRPFAAGEVFAYKLAEALLFSSWAFLFLALPLLTAYGVSDHARWYYYPGAALFFGLFALIPAALGGIIVLLLGRFMEISPRRILVAAAAATLVVALVWGLGLARAFHLSMLQSGQTWVQNVLGRLGLARSPALPSYWIAAGLQHLAAGELREAGYRFCLLLSTALFFGMAGIQLAQVLYLGAYHRSQAVTRRRKGMVVSRFYRFLERLLPGAQPELRILIVKDVKTFFRDPVQWSQMLVFFGLLGVYFLNMRNFEYNLKSEYWNNLIGLLNLIATSLTLSTFTSRFVFPLLSLEGRKFWILGLLPINRRNILYSKFWFAFAGAFAISEMLMVVSDFMLRAPWQAVGLHALAVLIISCGLSGLAVGTGALYPNLREDNPSKIVSGFGGTLNLILSVFFVASIVALMAVPWHVGEMERRIGGHFMRRHMGLGIGLGAILGVLCTWLPMRFGARAFEKLEV